VHPTATRAHASATTSGSRWARFRLFMLLGFTIRVSAARWTKSN
jgi:hypothetical protein